MRRAGFWIAAGLIGLLAACSSEDKTPGNSGKSGAAEILSFKADPLSIAPGASTTLSWSVKSATKIEIYTTGFQAVHESTDAEGSVELSPEKTVTYRLEAVGSDGARQTRELQVRVEEQVGPVVSFSADDTELKYGSSTRLSWRTEQAIRVLISDGSALPLVDTDRPEDVTRFSGDLDLSPSQSISYTLTATGPNGLETVAEVKIFVVPEITFFAAEIAKPVPVGTEIKLEWLTSGAEQLEITTPEGVSYAVPKEDRTHGDVIMAVGESGSFTLTATRGEGVSTMEYRVEIGNLPSIMAFYATPPAVNHGQTTSITLHWNVEEATSLSLDGVNVDLTGIPTDVGSVDVILSAETTLTLTAINAAGEDSREIVIPAVDLPVILSFTATPRLVGVQESFLIEWQTTGASSVELKRNEAPLPIDDAPSGTLEQAIDSTTTYELVVRNLAGTTVNQLLEVKVGAPTIQSFSIDNFRYAAGATISASWGVTGGVSLEILDGEGAAVAACTKSGTAEIASNGCAFTGPATFGVHTYTLRLTNGVGQSATRSLTALVSDGPVIADFSASATTLAQGEEITFNWEVIADVAEVEPSLAIADEDDNELVIQELEDHPTRGSGSIILDTPGTHTYTMTASTPGTFASTASVEVDVVGTPVFDSLNVTDPVTVGDPIIVEWETRFANIVEFSQVDALGDPLAHLYTVTTANLVREGSHQITTLTGAEGTIYLRIMLRNRIGVETVEIVPVDVIAP